MTFNEYNEQIKVMERKVIEDKFSDEALDSLKDFKRTHMQEFVDEYKRNAKGDGTKELIADLFAGTVEGGDSGSVVYYVETEEEANAINEIIWEEIGHFMLDAPEVYYDKYSGEWVIDCMFGGAYIPEWDETWSYLKEMEVTI